MKLNNYCKIFNLGHKAITDLFLNEVIIEEKIDGSQFSFGVRDGVLFCNSHHCQLNIDSAGMFQPACDYVKTIKDRLVDGWTYRGEFLAKPHHNVLQYTRIPQNHIILFDIDTGIEDYITNRKDTYILDKKEIAFTLGLECVPMIGYSIMDNQFCPIPYLWTESDLKRFLNLESCLGGTTIEGVVIKNYFRFGIDGHCLMGKYVSDKFKEMAQRHQKKVNPSNKDTIEEIGSELCVEARWLKAVQALREQNLLEDAPQDIGKLLKQVNTDIMAECSDYIKERLYSMARRKILQRATRGLPMWYKEELLKKQFNKESRL
jgi:hypothetical protein